MTPAQAAALAATRVRGHLRAVPAERTRVLIALGALALLTACSALSWSPRDLSRSDIHAYYDIAQKAWNGRVPYRAFELEYPPGALPAFLVPGSGVDFGQRTESAHPTPAVHAAEVRYTHSFVALMAALAVLLIAATSFSLAALRASLGRSVLALAVIATAPSVFGELFYGYFDLWPAALSAIALSVLLHGKTRAAAIVLGLAVSAKIYPALLLPATVTFAWKRVGRREALLALALVCATVFVVMLPFATLAPVATARSISDQARRGVQIESTASAAIVSLSQLSLKAGEFGISIPRPSFRLGPSAAPGISAREIRGRAVTIASGLTSALAVAVLLALWVGFTRSPATKEELVRCCAATLATAVLLGRVLSPQYLVWLLPFVPLAGGRRGLMATTLLVAALAVTHWWWLDLYRTFSGYPAPGTTVVLDVRNALLALLLLVLAWPRRVGPSTQPLT